MVKSSFYNFFIIQSNENLFYAFFFMYVSNPLGAFIKPPYPTLLKICQENYTWKLPLKSKRYSNILEIIFKNNKIVYLKKILSFHIFMTCLANFSKTGLCTENDFVALDSRHLGCWLTASCCSNTLILVFFFHTEQKLF